MTAYRANDTSVIRGPAMKKAGRQRPMERPSKPPPDDFPAIGGVAE